jgi:ribosomal-protein-alanine N-acetyltransferase
MAEPPPARGVPDLFPILRGEGLLLRELSEADLPAWFARLSDAESAALAGDPVASSIEAAFEGLRHHREAFRNKEGLRWAIVPDALGVSVGSIGLFRFDPAAASAEIGAVVGRAHWSQGIATRAARLVLGYAFDELGLRRIEAAVLERNHAVKRVLEKLGFERLSHVPPGRGVAAGAEDEVFFVRTAKEP